MVCAALDPSIALLLQTLAEMEKESAVLIKRNEIITFFCTRVIPFLFEHPLLAGIKKKWLAARECLDAKAAKAEQAAQKECIQTFQELKGALATKSQKPQGHIYEQMSLIDRLIKGEGYFSFPHSKALFNEIHALLRLLLSLGHEALCRRFCEIGKLSTYVPTSAQAGDGEGYCKPVEGEELQALRENDPRLFSLPAMDCMDVLHIDTCTFAPSLTEVFATNRATSWENHYDPAVVWWYFESALWCWNTPASYFTQKSQKREDASTQQKIFCDLNITAAWREIAGVRDTYRASDYVIIFTEKFFKTGLKTLVTDISAYLSLYSTPQAIQKSMKEEVVFELALDNGEGQQLEPSAIWVSVTIQDKEPEYYYLKRFNDSSRPFNFIKTILKQTQKGVITVELDGSSDCTRSRGSRQME